MTGDDSPHTDAVVLSVMTQARNDRKLGYGLMTGAALSNLFVVQSPSVSSQLWIGLQIAFGILWAASAGACFVGALTDWWLWEYVGLIPLRWSFLTFGAIILSTGFINGWAVLPAGLSLLALGFLFRARWKDVKFLYGFEEARRR